MKVKAVIIGGDALGAKLKALSRNSLKDDKDNVIVGFTQNYAVHVHENLHSAHKVGQAKYLETAYKKMMPLTFSLVAQIYQISGSIVKGLLVAGLRIQREAQKLTPVDTGALKASAYTAREKKSAAIINKAQARAWERQEQAKWNRS